MADFDPYDDGLTDELRELYNQIMESQRNLPRAVIIGWDIVDMVAGEVPDITIYGVKAHRMERGRLYGATGRNAIGFYEPYIDDLEVGTLVEGVVVWW